jgi:hypothetical protein
MTVLDRPLAFGKIQSLGTCMTCSKERACIVMIVLAACPSCSGIESEWIGLCTSSSGSGTVAGEDFLKSKYAFSSYKLSL